MNRALYFQEKTKIITKRNFMNDSTDGLKEAIGKLSFLISKRSLSSYHALLQYVIALNLFKKGYDVWVEKRLPRGLIADVYAEHPLGSVIIEVETGFIPRDCIDKPLGYLVSKIVYKAMRYSELSDLFFVALPAYISLPEEILHDKKQLTTIFLKNRYCFNNVKTLGNFKVNGIIKVFLDKLSIIPDPDLWW